MTGRSLKTVLVTGAEGALGGIVAQRFVSSGARTIGTYLKAPGADSRIHWVRTDVTDPGSVRESLAAAQSEHGEHREIDALVHCAGGFRFARIEETTDADLDFLFDVNLRSAFLLLRELLPGMRRRNFGRIVLVSSRATLQPPAGMSAYAAAKAGLNAIVSAVAEEVKAHDINVNAVLPTVIDTEVNRREMPSADFSTWVRPEDLAEIMFSLTQPWGRPVSGALLPVAGKV